MPAAAALILQPLSLGSCSIASTASPALSAAAKAFQPCLHTVSVSSDSSHLLEQVEHLQHPYLQHMNCLLDLLLQQC